MNFLTGPIWRSAAGAMACVCATIASAALQTGAAPRQDSQAIPRDVTLTVADALGVAVLSEVEMAVDAADPGKIDVVLEGRLLTLDLTPYSMRSEDCKFLVQDEQGVHAIEAPPVTTYRGAIAGDTEARVWASIVGNRLRALIEESDGTSWLIQPAPASALDATPGRHVAYRLTDVTPETRVCGTHGEHAVGMQAPVVPFEELESDVGLRGGPGDGRTQIGFDADYEFYVANGSSAAATVADIEWVMVNVAAIYQSQISDPICYELTGFIVRTTSADPYSSTNSSVLLCQFTNHWNSSVPDSGSGISRDVAHLFTGKELDGSIIGLAWVGTVCDASYSLTDCGSTGKAHYGLSQLISNDANRIQLTAHEIGHNWSACHCNQSGCTGGAADPDCGIMNSFVNGSLTFGSRARVAIDNYRDTVADCLTSCLTTLYVDSNAPFPGCLGSKLGNATCPYSHVSEGYSHFHWIGGVMRVAPGNYPGAVSFNSVYRAPMTLRMWDNGSPGFVRIGAP